jgi:hypothetical protein
MTSIALTQMNITRTTQASMIMTRMSMIGTVMIIYSNERDVKTRE